MKEAFGYADENGDNFVGPPELFKFFLVQKKLEIAVKVLIHLKVFDKDHNGKLDFSEFLEVTKKYHFIRERGQDEPMYFSRVVFALSWIHEKIDTSGVFCAHQ